jgi:hypothetical protein
VLFFGFHPLSRNRPDFCSQINFSSHCAYHFIGARSYQDDKRQASGGMPSCYFSCFIKAAISL